jgi:hypothetical protein
MSSEATQYQLLAAFQFKAVDIVLLAVFISKTGPVFIVEVVFTEYRTFKGE